MKFYSISELIKEAGGQCALAATMSVGQTQISRWLKAGAYVSEDGGLYFESSASYNKPVSVVSKLKINGVKHE